MNENIVSHLRDVIGLEPDEIADVYGIFLRSLSECLDRLHAASAPVDFLAVRAVTHNLMGFARNVGAAELGEAALALNTSAHAADAEACLLGIREIEALCASYRDDAPPQP